MLVAYEGDTPVLTTLTIHGAGPRPTPIGVFFIQRRVANDHRDALRAVRGQHQHRHARVVGAQTLQHLEAVHLGHRQVGEDGMSIADAGADRVPSVLPPTTPSDQPDPNAENPSGVGEGGGGSPTTGATPDMLRPPTPGPGCTPRPPPTRSC